uniref:Uncharacterized protein n=1 Tax=Rhizophora mucronata TaxID=61149 RepID=A0A2P2LMA0_RHIMU
MYDLKFFSVNMQQSHCSGNINIKITKISDHTTIPVYLVLEILEDLPGLSFLFRHIIK